MNRRRSAIDRFGVVGYSHRQIPARLRGMLAFDDAWCTRLATQLREAKVADGVAFVSTCNRQEVVLSAEHPGYALELVRSQLHGLLLEKSGGPLPEPYRHVGEDAVRHVLRVSASLESLVVGERQITQQVRRSFEKARTAGWMDKSLNGLARIAVENAKAIHVRTTLAAESVGVFALARDLVARETTLLARPKVVVLGLGEIGLKTARAFTCDSRVELTLSSRRPRTSTELGGSLESCRQVPWENLAELVSASDAVVVATGARTPVLDEIFLAAARSRHGRDLVLVDLGIPPQVATEVETLPGVRLYNLDWFAASGFGQRPQAKEALKKAQEIVEEGVDRVAAWTSVRRFSGLFDSCVMLTDHFKSQRIPEVLKSELGSLSPAHQRAVFSAMHDLMTQYSEGIFQTLNRELNDRVQPAGAEDGDPREADDR